MKDTSVAATGLFSPERQRRLINALMNRFATCERERQVLIGRHATEREREEQNLLSDRSNVTAECRTLRRETLGKWDAAEEVLFGKYESDTIRMRQDLSRMDVLFRKKLESGTASIARKVEARKAAVNQQYDACKHEPHEKCKKEVAQLKASLGTLTADLTTARDLTLSRLDGLPSVGPAENPQDDMREPPPESVQHAIETIAVISRKLTKLVAEMQTGASARLVDSIYLPLAVAVGMILWAIGISMVQPSAFWPILVGGVVVIGLVGFVGYLAILFPLRKETRRLFPLIKRCDEAADEAASTGKNIAKETAKKTAAELISKRNKHLQAADVWQDEQLEELRQRLATEQQQMKADLTNQLTNLGTEFQQEYGQVNSQMHQQAERVAAEITGELSHTDQALKEQMEQSARKRYQELERVTDRMRIGVSAGLQRIESASETARERFPDWAQLAQSPQTDLANLDFLPLGKLQIGPTLARSIASKQTLTSSETAGAADMIPMFTPDQIPGRMPISLHRRLHSGMIIHAAPDQMDAATDLVRQVLWRMLSGTAGGRTKLTLIDPIGRGQSFSSFMSFADYDPALVGHRVWTTENQIESRLGEIAQHAEDVLQSSLRDQFERVEDYNELAGSMAEPYRAVAAIGFPEGLTRGGYKHLKALIESGIRCGVFTLLVCEKDKPWPSDLPIPRDRRMLEFSVDEAGHWSLNHDGLQELKFDPDPNLPAEYRSELVAKIGKAAVESARVEVPLQSLLPDDGGGAESTDGGVEITIGSQGGHRKLALDLGEGVQQHVLIAGKTGSGKSTLLHSIITSGAFHYTPDELQYYLLDFKKGVEFKAYADARLPHAHVIGIESEREFGRSVLQRLDQELQQRGELFRSESAQELSEYRKSSGKPMPRIMLVIDEFQELFVRDDRVSSDCAMLLDRLVRQGRSFGMHVVLSSQSLAGAYSLPRATLGQMAVRIAMQCSESDAALILSDENTAARLITRPGEAIYNDAGGLVEGNQPFQVAWLGSDQQKKMLADIFTRDESFIERLPPPVVFQGNRPCHWTPALASAAIDESVQSREEVHGLLGESVEIGPPVALQLSRNAGRNVLMIPPPEARAGLLASVLSGFAKSNSELEIVYFNGSRTSESPSLVPWLQRAGMNVREVKPRDCVQEMAAIAETVKQRGDEAENVHPIVVVVDPLDRFRDFRHEDAFSFSLDATPGSLSGGQVIRDVLKDGPPANVFAILVCGGAEIVSRWLPRQSQHDMELRVLGRLNASDSSVLIDSPVATELSAATMLLYDEPAGKITKFRQPKQPEAFDAKAWLEKTT